MSGESKTIDAIVRSDTSTLSRSDVAEFLKSLHVEVKATGEKKLLTFDNESSYLRRALMDYIPAAREAQREIRIKRSFAHFEDTNKFDETAEHRLAPATVYAEPVLPVDETFQNEAAKHVVAPSPFEMQGTPNPFKVFTKNSEYRTAA
jgi:hypothetical protein